MARGDGPSRHRQWLQRPMPESGRVGTMHAIHHPDPP